MTDILGNIDLNPETNQTFEVGFDATFKEKIPA